MVKTMAPELLAPNIAPKVPELVTATRGPWSDGEALLARARGLAQPLIEDQQLDSGENMFAHAEAIWQARR